jgi:hypothetical protein
MRHLALATAIIFVSFIAANAQTAITAGSADDFYRLTESAAAAFNAGDHAKAKDIANELLAIAPEWKKDWNYGNAIHTANLVLGRIALRDGDKELASRYLLAAGETPGSPQLDSFGPDMLFAKEMLEAGERDIVLKYFDLCSEFWKRHKEQLDEWRASVEKGEMPKFGANLRYVFGSETKAAR